MSSTEAPTPSGSISDIALSFCTIAASAALITIGCGIYSGVFVHEIGLRVLVYTALGVALNAGIIVWIVRVKRWPRISYAVCLVLALEALLAAKFLAQDHRHHAHTAGANATRGAIVSANFGASVFHPRLSIAPTPDFDNGVMTHTSDGLRRTVDHGAPGAPTVLVIGGSTTYTPWINDGDAWPSRLSEATGFHVVNMGFLGYSSAEHLVQTAFDVPEHEAACALYYVGWNDIRSNGSQDLSADYSEFHARSLYQELTPKWNEFDISPYTVFEHSAIIHQLANAPRASYLRNFAEINQEVFQERRVGGMTNGVNEKALGIFVQNMRSIVALNASRGLKTIFVPQVMNDFKLVGNEPTEWMPFFARRDVRPIIDAYNDALKALGEETGTPVLDDVLTLDWRAEHFIDEGHFTPLGNQLFADAIANDVLRLCGPASES